MTGIAEPLHLTAEQLALIDRWVSRRSGSGFLDAQGRAVGTLSTVAIAPLSGSNGLGNLRRELAFAREHSGIEGLRLLHGRQPFSSLL